ncbi:MAG: HIT domain-containing protein [Candidatus Omnitrophica bacterium]|nr:HIT domain-containing protein [Candidatus Omnitrophota bacterium]
MQRIWAPWRKAYIRPEGRKTKGCLFCGLWTKNRDSQNYILKRTASSFAVLNLYPYNTGHTLIVTKRHVDSIRLLTAEEILDWIYLYEEIRLAIQKTMKPHGFNVGINLGKVSGSGIPDHLHLHVVPRWIGDSNFMPLIGGTKVISESLCSVYRAITGYFRKKPRIRRGAT